MIAYVACGYRARSVAFFFTNLFNIMSKPGEAALALVKLKREQLDAQRELYRKQAELTKARLEIQAIDKALGISKR